MSISNPDYLPSLRTGTFDEEILDAFAARLCEIPGLNNGLVVVSDQPVPYEWPFGKIGITVSQEDGRFDERSFASGGADNLLEQTTVVVAIYANIGLLDRGGRSEVAVRSLRRWKRDVLAYLLRQNPCQRRSQPWEPIIQSKALLSSLPRPNRCSGIRDVPKKEGWAGLELRFDIDFHWDLVLTDGG